MYRKVARTVQRTSMLLFPLHPDSHIVNMLLVHCSLLSMCVCAHISFVISLFLKLLRVERANCSHDVPSLLNTPVGIFPQTGTLFYITANNLPHQEISIGTTLLPHLLSPFKFRPLSQQCFFSFLGQHAIQE